MTALGISGHMCITLACENEFNFFFKRPCFPILIKTLRLQAWICNAVALVNHESMSKTEDTFLRLFFYCCWKAVWLVLQAPLRNS